MDRLLLPQLSNAELSDIAAAAIATLKVDARAELLGLRFTVTRVSGSTAGPGGALTEAKGQLQVAAEAEVRMPPPRGDRPRFCSPLAAEAWNCPPCITFFFLQAIASRPSVLSLLVTQLSEAAQELRQEADSKRNWVGESTRIQAERAAVRDRRLEEAATAEDRFEQQEVSA